MERRDNVIILVFKTLFLLRGFAKWNFDVIFDMKNGAIFNNFVSVLVNLLFTCQFESANTNKSAQNPLVRPINHFRPFFAILSSSI